MSSLGEVALFTDDVEGASAFYRCLIGAAPVEHRGYVPPRAVVLPGTRSKEYPAGRYDLPCALIVGTRTASTDLKTSLNDVLREFEIAT